MKRLIKISLLLVSILMLLTIISNAFTAETTLNKNNIKVGEETVYKIKLDEKVIAANFDIVYDSKSFELIESKTFGLNVAEKDGKIACIYLDINQQGTDEFEIVFKAIKAVKEATFSTENVKFRVAGQKESYTLKNTTGLDEQSIKVTNTVMTKLMWLAVIGIGVIVMESIILLIINKLKNKDKVKKSTKVMSIILALFVFGTLSSNVQATSTDIVINFSKIGEEKIVQIMLSKDDSDRQVTKEEIIAKNNTITSIKDKQGNEIDNSAIVKTGYTLVTANGTSKVIVLGDANGDGIVCDTDDIMVIIEDYLGKVQANDIVKIAANLYNNDEVLDTDDVMQMINMYLGNLQGQLLSVPIENNEEETNASTEGVQAKFGDLVAYNSNVNAKWRIWKIDGTEIQIMPVENLLQNVSYGFKKWFVSVQLSNNGPFTGSNWVNDELNEHPEFNTFINCFNSDYAKEMSFPLYQDYIDYENSTDANTLQIFNNYFKGEYLSYRKDRYGCYQTATSSGDPYADCGLRPVVTLKSNVTIASGTGTESDPFVLQVN